MDEKKYIATDCPVCNEFYFSELTEEDVQDGDDGLSRFCHVCGWKYNVEQINEPSVKNIEGFDIHELKNRFLDLRKQDKKYNYLLSIATKSEKHECPVCGKYLFKNVDDHDICPFCHWENDSYGESNPNSDGGANDISLNEAKHIWNSNN